MRRFNSDADVQEYFALQAEMRPAPEPPADLWEQLAMVRRAAVKMGAKKRYPLSQPDLTSLVFPKIRSKPKVHPIRSGQRLGAVHDVRPPAKKIYNLKGDI